MARGYCWHASRHIVRRRSVHLRDIHFLEHDGKGDETGHMDIADLGDSGRRVSHIPLVHRGSHATKPAVCRSWRTRNNLLGFHDPAYIVLSQLHVGKFSRSTSQANDMYLLTVDSYKTLYAT